MLCRTIAVPGLGNVDVTPILPIVDHELFQGLRSRRQLGAGYFTFVGATHSRFEHSLGTFHLTRARTSRWIDAGIITPQ